MSLRNNIYRPSPCRALEILSFERHSRSILSKMFASAQYRNIRKPIFCARLFVKIVQVFLLHIIFITGFWNHSFFRTGDTFWFNFSFAELVPRQFWSQKPKVVFCKIAHRSHPLQNIINHLYVCFIGCKSRTLFPQELCGSIQEIWRKGMELPTLASLYWQTQNLLTHLKDAKLVYELGKADNFLGGLPCLLFIFRHDLLLDSDTWWRIHNTAEMNDNSQPCHVCE